MRIERRVLVVEADHEADVDDAVLHPVDEGAAERVHVERIAEGVDRRGRPAKRSSGSCQSSLTPTE